jgi:hypothetical protein
MNTDPNTRTVKNINFSTLCLILARAVQEYEPGSSGSVVTSDI